jgi:hypothetical protein
MVQIDQKEDRFPCIVNFGCDFSKMLPQDIFEEGGKKFVEVVKISFLEPHLRDLEILTPFHQILVDASSSRYILLPTFRATSL